MVNYRLIKDREDYMLLKEEKLAEEFFLQRRRFTLKGICGRLERMAQSEEDVDFSRLRPFSNMTKQDYDKILAAYLNGFRNQ